MILLKVIQVALTGDMRNLNSKVISGHYYQFKLKLLQKHVANRAKNKSYSVFGV